ncbi:hypothetical protein SERLA73DRAFT_185832 [Serpula lacrymans var. lacrymans S7.3]|uniref:ADF-H domain-containing protein n=2 Tax=Serpula lacrymans var. lacrymans TaxID=341189 RepID=F8Q6G6_SERL3|nr:uncharacterized protein SERLADRAFT_474568 [Serpula lacrymans var. lacrymans S7.9]EGN96204.1 hypothetical protein SERLA73DRAFT_185832 [Serpula lacrymans var. lacrymans S7.3]EGO21741.1 hypothetical protein SERLADRAFT_474568 [Serpula lacrymans var. lacrymans S7.9]
MSATSGIQVSPELVESFSAAVESKQVRFIKVAIRMHDESLAPVAVIDVSGSLEEDLLQLQDLLDDKEPAYVLTRLDDPPSEWLAINYVPDSATVRDKMLYASTRNSLTKSLGSAVFTDSLFATDKTDVLPEAYAAHKRHLAAPKPLSAREQELADVKAAEREGSSSAYNGSRSRVTHIPTGPGWDWPEDVRGAVEELATHPGNRLVVLHIDPSSGSLVLGSAVDVTIDALGSSLPKSEPAYAFFAWPNTYSTSGRDIIYIYSCPSSSPVKYRMTYASGALSVFQSTNNILATAESTCALASRKIQTSDPAELGEAFIMAELGYISREDEDTNTQPQPEVVKSFAKPKGPGRRR